MSDASGPGQRIADAYSQASLAGADMRDAMTDLESVRDQLGRTADPPAGWRALNAVIATRFPDDVLVPVLVTLRDRVLQDQLDLAREQLDALAADDGPAAALQWVQLIEQAVDDENLPVMRTVAGWAAERPFLDASLGAATQAAAQAFETARYVETRPFLERLADFEGLSQSQGARLRLMIILGEIALFREEDLPSARRRITEARSIRPEDPASFQLESDCTSKMSDWESVDRRRRELLDEADRLLTAAEEHAPRLNKNVAAVLSRRGDLTVKLATVDVHRKVPTARDESDEAESYYRAAVALEPENGYHLRSLASHLVRRGAAPDDPQVAPLIELARILMPHDDAFINVELAVALIDSGELDGARRALENTVATAPANLDVVVTYGQLLQVADELDTARRWLADSERRAPGSFEIPRAEAWLAEAQGDWQDALRLHELALDRRPSAEAAVRADLASVHLSSGNVERAGAEAVRACRRLLADGDLHGVAVTPATGRLLDVVDAMEDTDQVEEGLGYLDVVRELRGESFEAAFHNRRGVLLHNADRYAEAVHDYQLAVYADDAEPQYWHNLKLSLLAIGDLAGAESASERAYALDGDESARNTDAATIRNQRGNAAYGANDLPTAVEHYREAISFAPDDAVIRANLATALTHGAPPLPVEESLAEALVQLERAVEIDPVAHRDELARVRRRLSVVRGLGSFVLSNKPFRRLRVVLSEDVVPLFVDDERRLRTSVTQRLDDGRHDVAYGIPRPGVGFSESADLPYGTAQIFINGEVWSSVPVTDQDAVLDELEQVFVLRAAAFIGPDAVVEAVENAGRHDLVPALTDPDVLLRLSHVLRSAAAPGRNIGDVVPPTEA